MSVFFIADMHFDDDNIRRYENRPFETVQDMNDAIVKNWNDAVEEGDEVYIIGDIGNEEYIEKLNGKKYLVKGNHDKLTNEEYRKIGFENFFFKILFRNGQFHNFLLIIKSPIPVQKTPQKEV